LAWHPQVHGPLASECTESWTNTNTMLSGLQDSILGAPNYIMAGLLISSYLADFHVVHSNTRSITEPGIGDELGVWGGVETGQERCLAPGWRKQQGLNTVSWTKMTARRLAADHFDECYYGGWVPECYCGGWKVHDTLPRSKPFQEALTSIGTMSDATLSTDARISHGSRSEVMKGRICERCNRSRLPLDARNPSPAAGRTWPRCSPMNPDRLPRIFICTPVSVSHPARVRTSCALLYLSTRLLPDVPSPCSTAMAHSSAVSI
jgi:hypothetical protein